MVVMGKWSKKLAEFRASPSWEPDAVAQKRLLPYREPDIPRGLVTLRKLSWRIAPLFLIVTLFSGFFLLDWVRYGLTAAGERLPIASSNRFPRTRIPRIIWTLAF